MKVQLNGVSIADKVEWTKERLEKQVCFPSANTIKLDKDVQTDLFSDFLY